MSDLAFAAAFAGGGTDSVMLEALAQRADDVYSAPDSSVFELPSVDDLEVAAAAAAAAFEPLQQETDSSEEETDSDEESSDSDDESSSSEGQAGEHETLSTPAAAGGVQKHAKANTTGEVVRLELKVVEEDSTAAPSTTAASSEGKSQVQVVLTIQPGAHLSKSSLQAEWRQDNSPPESETDDDEEMVSRSETDEEPLDLSEMRDLIRKAYDDVDEGEDAAVAQKSIGEQLGLPELQPMDIEIGAGEALQLAGTVTAVMEGMVVAQAPENSRPLAEGSVLCLEDRTPLGRLEEVFGPVSAPMYAFRYAGKGPLPSGLIIGAKVQTVARLADFVSADELYGSTRRGTPAAAEPEAAASDEEVCFSDDEKEAEYQRKLKAKRKHPAEDSGPPTAGHARGGHSGPGRGRAGARHGRGGRWGNQQAEQTPAAGGRGPRGSAGAPRQPTWPPQAPAPSHTATPAEHQRWHGNHGGRGQTDRHAPAPQRQPPPARPQFQGRGPQQPISFSAGSAAFSFGDAQQQMVFGGRGGAMGSGPAQPQQPPPRSGGRMDPHGRGGHHAASTRPHHPPQGFPPQGPGNFGAPQGFSQQGMGPPHGFDQQGMGPPQGFSQQGMGPPQGFGQQGMGPPQGFGQQGMGLPQGFSQQGMGPPQDHWGAVGGPQSHMATPGYQEPAGPSQQPYPGDGYGGYPSQHMQQAPFGGMVAGQPGMEQRQMGGGFGGMDQWQQQQQQQQQLNGYSEVRGAAADFFRGQPPRH